MNDLLSKVIRKTRAVYESKFQKEVSYNSHIEHLNFGIEASNDEIKSIIEAGKPAMICRFGSTELNTMTTFFLAEERSFWSNVRRYIKGEIPQFWVDNETIESIMCFSGFFPKDMTLLRKFYELMLQDIQLIDVLGSWRKEEVFFHRYFPNAKRIPLKGLEPYYHESPWSLALKDKKVLVIHPFTESIQAQYQHRTQLFSEEVLPAFELKVIRAIQSIAFEETQYRTWFEALESMKDKINALDFDIAIIGCGAYGLPLAAHVKRLGKQAIHLGGATQIMFGIKGKRWEDSPFFKHLFNEHWVYPLDSEKPQHHAKVEGGCYW